VDNIKIDLGEWYGLDWSGYCKYGSEPSGFINGEILEQLRNQKFLKEFWASWS
jgi:hypothetical protein